MTDYWKRFWLSHAKENQHNEPQIQVLRTLNKQPVDSCIFADIVESIALMLKPEPNHSLLDLCCGNGLITRELFSRFKTVSAVDLSQEFVSQLSRELKGHITTFAADARTIEFPANSFDRILLYAGIQYFSESETINLFLRLKHWIKDGGRVVIGDIPDATRKWDFFNSEEREHAYFEALRIEEPIVGYWFEPQWLEKLGNHTGFASAAARLQPDIFPFQHYRFDLVLIS